MRPTKILKGLINTVFYITLLVFIIMVVTWAINDCDRTKMNFFGYSVHPVMSASMEPTILTGDLVMTEKITFDEIEVGDIIVYKHTYETGKYRAIIHRVVEKYDDYLICKGDNNEIADPWKIYPEDVRSIVIKY